MAIAFRGSSANSNTNGGSVTTDLATLSGPSGSASIQNGDFVVAMYELSSTSDKAMSMTTSGMTLTEQTELYANGSTSDTNMAVYTGFWATGNSTSITYVGDAVNSTGVAWQVHVFSGVDPTTPLDIAIATATGTGTGRPTPPAVTPVTAGAWIVALAAAAAGTGSSITNPGDWATTPSNIFRSAISIETTDAATVIGVKTDWSSGTFTPAQMTGSTTGAGDSWAAATLVLRPASTTPVFDQQAFRFYGNNTPETAQTAVTPQDTNYQVLPSDAISRHLRIRIKNTGGDGAATDDYQLKYSANGGSYVNVPAYTGSEIISYHSGVFTEGSATSNQLTGGTGTFAAGEVSNDGLVDDLTIQGSKYTELLFAVAYALGTDGDTYDFRVYRNGSPLDTYSITPRIVVLVPRGSTQAYMY